MPEQFRRTDPRYTRRLEVELSASGRTGTAHSRNVSLGGMFLEVEAAFAAALPLGATVQLRFRVPTQPEAVEVGGEVRWMDKVDGPPGDPGAGLVGVGVRFHGLRARDVWALNRFFQTQP